MTGEGSLFDVPPAAIGRYRVQHPLGAGTCGPVFKGESPDGATVALKLLTIPIRPERLDDVLDGLQRLVADGASVADTVDPIDAGLHDGTTPYLVSSLASGDSLDVALRRFGPALLTDVLPRLSLLAGALDRLASVELHHGALHPRDIIVDEASTVMTGAGVWQALAAGGVRLPRRSPYRAPELTDLALSAAGDQFALAAVAYEWMTGRRAPTAFVAGDMAASVGARRDVLGAVFARAMHLDPGERFGSCQAFVDELRRIDLGQGEVAEPSVVVDERPRRRSRPAAEPFPLLTLEVDASPEPEMPLQAVAVSLDTVPETPVPDLPLQEADRDEGPRLSVMPVVTAAPDGVSVSPSFRGDGLHQAPPPSDRPYSSDDAPIVSDVESDSPEMIVDTTSVDEHPLTLEAPSLVPASRGEDARTFRADAERAPAPPVLSSSPAPPDAWMARVLLVVVGVALGISIGYAVWGRSGGRPDGRQVVTTAELAGGSTEEGAATPLATGGSGAAVPTSAPGAQPPASEASRAPVAEPEAARVPPTAPATAPPVGTQPGASTVDPSTRSLAPGRPTQRQRNAQPAATGPRVTAARRGAVRATSTPPGAMVMLDGKLVGKSPMTVRYVPPGAHTIEFRRQGHRPVTLPVAVKAGATARVSATLPRAQEPQ